MAKETLKDFMYLESSENSLTRVSNIDILKSIIDPTTSKPYDGIILEGEFASIDTLNNNNRIYTEENYIGFIEILKRQIHSPKGVYGELEHPKGYATDSNNISHKILDIWYDRQKKKVFGIIMLLNTPKGLIAQEVIKSGGQLAVSARGGGSEVQNPDGSITAVLKLLITFDIVYHPGFSSSIVEYTKLNENHNFEESKITKNGKVSLCIYEPELGKISELYESFIMKKDTKNLNFLQWCVTEKLFESTNNIQEEEQDIDKLEKNQTAQEDNVEDELQNAVQNQLKQSQQKAFYQQMKNANKKLDAAFYDGSAGFLINEEEF